MDTQEGMEAYEESRRRKIKLGTRIPAKAEKDSPSVELPGAAMKSEGVSGSFGSRPDAKERVGDPVFAPSLALPLRLAQDAKGIGDIAKTHANQG